MAISGQAALSTTLQRGGMRVEWIGQRLGLRNHVIDEGKRMFQLAAQRNFTTGRKTAHVAAACMYIVCRRDREPYLLLDFADALHASVRELGQIYMKLVRLLNLDKVLDIPVVDPSLFMERFSARLELGHKGTQLVSHTAARIIQAMSRHWICTGRRPTGLCGAALLVACRYHGFERSPAALAEIVRIGEVTIRKRLVELQQTPTAALTMDQFEAVTDQPADAKEIGYESLPPCLIRNRERERKQILRGITDERPRLFVLEDVCAESPTESQILSVADSLIANLGGMDSVSALMQVDEPDGVSVADLSDISDDDEIEEYMLTEEESLAKSAIWHEWNKPFLEEWAIRDAKKRELERAGGKKKRQAKVVAATASQATQDIIDKKAKSLVKKVNPDILDSLFRK